MVGNAARQPKPYADSQDDGFSADLAHWLEESGRRHVQHPKDSPERLLQFLEEVAGQRIESREDILRYFNKLSARETQAREARRKRQLIRQTILVVLLGLSVGQYYYWQVQLEIAASQKNYYFVPPDPTGPVRVLFRSSA